MDLTTRRLLQQCLALTVLGAGTFASPTLAAKEEVLQAVPHGVDGPVDLSIQHDSPGGGQGAVATTCQC